MKKPARPRRPRATGLLKEALVARPQPAVCAERRCRRAFVAEVRQHRAVSADAELAALIGGQRGPVGVDDLHLGARQRAADAGQLSAVKQPPAFFLGQIGRKAAREVRVLGQPPALQQAELGLFLEVARQARGQRRRRDEDRPQGRDLLGADAELQERRQQRRDHAGQGDRLDAHDLAPRERIEPLREDEVSAGRQRRHEAEPQRVRVVERQHRELRLVFEAEVERHAPGVGEQAPLSQGDPFGVAGGAGGVKDDRHLLRQRFASAGAADAGAAGRASPSGDADSSSKAQTTSGRVVSRSSSSRAPKTRRASECARM